MASDIGQAYVQIVPSAKGIKGSISNILNGEANSAGEKAGGSIGGKIKGAIIASGIAVAVQQSIMQGAKLEQSLGGVETLYGKAAETVKKNAADAWKTAGLSANSYMEQSTMFAASLLQSLGGDTAKAAKYADMALVDMSDNANKFGTDIASIQNAYQGFSKQNYTMLDNLKLGYGGTKTEMERLLKDASALSGKKYDISNLNDIYDAIHAVQGKLGVTGTTAKEASTTLSGSFDSMKSAATNLLGNLTLGENVEGSTKALVESTETFLIGNLAPAIGRILMSIPKMLITGIPILVKAVQGLLTKVMDNISNNGGEIFGNIGKLLISLGNIIGENLPILTQSIVSFMLKLGALFIQNLPIIIQTLLSIGAKIVSALANGIIQSLGIILNGIGRVISVIVSPITNFINRAKTLGSNIILGLTSGIASVIANVKAKVNAVKTALITPIETAKNKIKSIIDKIKIFFKNLILKIPTPSLPKLPHFSLTMGSKSVLGKTIKYPTGIDVNWYANGGVFDQASVIGVGEAGAEAVVPLDTFWSKMDNMANSITNSISNVEQGGGAGTVVIELDSSIIAKAVIEYINGQTQRYGTSPLNI